MRALCELIALAITCLSSFIVAKSALLTTEPHLQLQKQTQQWITSLKQTSDLF